MKTKFDFTNVGLDNMATHSLKSIVQMPYNFLRVTYVNHSKNSEEYVYLTFEFAKDMKLINFELLNKMINQ